MKGADHPGRIVAVEALAAEIGLRPGDELLSVNGHEVRDVIDVQFYAAEPELELLIRRQGELWLYEVEREYNQSLGLTFEHPTFDTDIRRCNNHCLFCFVTQMIPPSELRSDLPPLAGDSSIRRRFRRALYIQDDDYRYSFLDGNYVTLTNLEPEDWERIEEQRLSPLYVSVHATQRDLRRALLGNPAAPDIMDQLRRLAAWGIQVHTQLVLVPGMNDGPHLVRSVRDLAELWPAVQSVSVVPVGLTRFHRGDLRTHSPAEAAAVLDQVQLWGGEFLAQLGERLVYATDEWYLLAGRPFPPLDDYPQMEALQENGLGLVRQFLDDWERLSLPAFPGSDLSLVLATGTLFGPVLEPVAAEFARRTGLRVEVRPMVNQSLGETITVAGLLMGQDLVKGLANLVSADLLILPRVMFRGPEGVTLDGMSPADISAVLGRPVALAESMGEVAQLTGRFLAEGRLDR